MLFPLPKGQLNKVAKPNELILKIIQEEITRSYEFFKQKEYLKLLLHKGSLLSVAMKPAHPGSGRHIQQSVCGMVYRIGLMTDQVKGAFNLKDPYGEGWIFEMRMSDSAQLANLMKGEIAKHAKKKK